MPPITTGCLTSMWLHLQPPFSANITLSGAIRFDRKYWENMEVELHNSRIDVCASTLPIDLNRKTTKCPVEIVSLIEADQSNSQDLVKYRIRRRYTQLIPGEPEAALLVSRLTFGNAMTTLSNDSFVSSTLQLLWKTTKQMKPKTMALLLGKSFSDNTTGTNNKIIKNSKSSKRDFKSVQSWQMQMSPWQGEDGAVDPRKTESPLPSPLSKTSMTQSISEASLSSQIGAQTASQQLTKDEFTAVYVALWRVLVGTFIHLDVHPATDRKRKYDATVPRREQSKRAGHWLGLHPDYRTRAIEQAHTDWNIFARSNTFMRSGEFEMFLMSVCELNVHRRTKDDVAHFFTVLERCLNAMFKASHAVSHRIFPATLLYEPRATSSALEHMTNDGFVVVPPRASSRNSNCRNNVGDINILEDGITGNSILSNTPRDKELFNSEAGNSHDVRKARKGFLKSSRFRRGGGRNEAQQRAAASLSNDGYLKPECHRYTIGRRTPMTPMPEDRSITPGPGSYSPWSSYPFAGPFGAHGETTGFPFEKSLGRVDSPRTRHREKEIARRRDVASKNGPMNRKANDIRKARLADMLTRKKNNDYQERMNSLAINSANLNIVSKSLYNTEELSDRREWKSHWKARKIFHSLVMGAGATPLSAKEYEMRMKKMCVLGAPESQSKWSVVPQKRSEQMLRQGRQFINRQHRRSKESMSTMCHPGRYNNSTSSPSSRSYHNNRRRRRQKQQPQQSQQSQQLQQLQQSQQFRRGTAADQMLPQERNSGTFFEQHGDGGWNDEDDEDDEIIYHEDMLKGDKDSSGDGSTDVICFGTAPKVAPSNTIVDDALNVLYEERRVESGGDQPDDELTLFVEKDGGGVPKDIFWQQQRTSAHAIMQSFANSHDMSAFGRSCDPHTDRATNELKSTRLDGEMAWISESHKLRTAPRVQGGLEQVLIKRAARRRGENVRLKQYR